MECFFSYSGRWGERESPGGGSVYTGNCLLCGHFCGNAMISYTFYFDASACVCFITVYLCFMRVILVNFVIFRVRGSHPFLLFGNLLSYLINVSVVGAQDGVPMTMRFKCLRVTIYQVRLMYGHSFFAHGLNQDISSYVQDYFRVRYYLSFCNCGFFTEEGGQAICGGFVVAIRRLHIFM